MKVAHNFNAGPCVLPRPAVQAAIDALNDFKGTGMSVIEVSHRSKEWEAVMEECRTLWKELLEIPDGYQVLFLGGGASLQFLYVAMNLLENKAGYLETGVWAKKALAEAKALGNAVAIASSKDKNFSYIPKGYEIPADLDYFHITTNNTIYGTEIKKDMDCPVNLVADMSSDIMSRPVDVSKYALIYGGAQKNVGPAGVTFVIVKEEILGKVSRYLPTMLDYRTHIKESSMFNTPPCINIFAVGQTLKWIKQMGGVEAMERRAIERCNALYSEFDRNTVFRAVVEEGSRSRMNIPFLLAEGYEELEKEFLDFCKSKNIVGVKRHRLVGGFRASTYNACTMEDVNALIAAMQEFEKAHKK